MIEFTFPKDQAIKQVHQKNVIFFNHEYAIDVMIYLKTLAILLF